MMTKVDKAGLLYWVMSFLVLAGFLHVELLVSSNASAEATPKSKSASDNSVRLQLARLRKLVDLQARAHTRLEQVTKKKLVHVLQENRNLQQQLKQLKQELQTKNLMQVKQQQRIQSLEALARTMSRYQSLLQHWLHPTRKPGERQPIAGLPGAYRRWIPGGMF